jgi:hypothetical protein
MLQFIFLHHRECAKTIYEHNGKRGAHLQTICHCFEPHFYYNFFIAPFLAEKKKKKVKKSYNSKKKTPSHPRQVFTRVRRRRLGASQRCARGKVCARHR